MKMSVFRRTVCVVNSHFAAHMEKVASRNADFEYVYKQMAFGQRPNYAAGAAAGVHLFVSAVNKWQYLCMNAPNVFANKKNRATWTSRSVLFYCWTSTVSLHANASDDLVMTEVCIP